MPTWAIVVIVVLILASIETAFESYHTMLTDKEFLQYATKFKEIQTKSINEGLEKAEAQYKEMKSSGDFHDGDTFVFSDTVTGVVKTKENDTYFSIYIERTNLSKDENYTKKTKIRILQSNRLLKSS